MSYRLFYILIMIFISFSCMKRSKDNFLSLDAEVYKEKVYASWLGQIVGNTYGLSYEFAFIDETGPDSFPYGYGKMLDTLRKYDGAFSDDDTDIEYMYLVQMEKHGVEPTYFQLTEAWKKHVKTKVWCANRVALTLMNAGHYPPVTGNSERNKQWMQIDPQLVNEIWAVTAPGMIDYAISKSAFTARITNDSFGIEPTLFYAAMYSAAFFEGDIEKLIAIGLKSIPKNAAFIDVVKTVEDLYEKYPVNWQKARRIVKDKYLIYGEHNKYAWPPIDAHLNGALGIMALLYGEGDFQKTLDYCCAFGMDADNQAATMCGLLGIINGLEGIPAELLFPLEKLGWSEAFNDHYKMITREGLEDAGLKDMAKRIADMGEKIILKNGGSIISKEGKKFYKINAKAFYEAPFELNPVPLLTAEKGKITKYPIYTGRSNSSFSLMGNYPPDSKIENGNLNLIGKQKGLFQFELLVESGSEVKRSPVKFWVFENNLAASAESIQFNQNAVNRNIEIIRDGEIEESYHSIKEGESREIDYYGYTWAEVQSIEALLFNNGMPNEYCGWFTTFDVEYLKDGNWTKINQYEITPDLNLDNSQWLKGHFIDHLITFEEIRTKGIRIKGLSGGVKKDEANAHLGMQYYTSISELRVY